MFKNLKFVLLLLLQFLFLKISLCENHTIQLEMRNAPVSQYHFNGWLIPEKCFGLFGYDDKV